MDRKRRLGEGKVGISHIRYLFAFAICCLLHWFSSRAAIAALTGRVGIRVETSNVISFNTNCNGS